MLQRVFHTMIGTGSQPQPLGFTVMQPVINNNALPTGQPTATSAVTSVPPPNDPEDYELRFSIDLVRQTLQPQNVVGLSESHGAQLIVYAQPAFPASKDDSSSQGGPVKVYEAPAHNPRDPMPYQVGREYLLCLRFPAKSAVALLSVTAEEQQVHTREFAALPYWSMKCLERGPR